MDPGAALPYQAVAHDALRHGLASLKEDAAAPHPVQVIQQTTPIPGVECANPAMLRDLYGLAFPARVALDRQILAKFGRLPGLPSSRLGLESLTGELDQFGFESYLGLPEDSTDAPVELHSQMEARLGMAKATRPPSRHMW
ncbi:CYCB1-2 [Scenedesmus sp. PABB004]|nr:CYCB1-2 [Scenedesmus sp. PABB004]